MIFITFLSKNSTGGNFNFNFAHLEEVQPDRQLESVRINNTFEAVNNWAE